jgi:hypothetical protein
MVKRMVAVWDVQGKAVQCHSKRGVRYAYRSMIWFDQGFPTVPGNEVVRGTHPTR